LVAELVKINLFLIFQFFLLYYSGIVLCSVLQSGIRALVVSVFLYRCMMNFGRPKIAKIFFVIYLVAVIGFDLFLSVDIFMDDGQDCSKETDWQVIALISVDTI